MSAHSFSASVNSDKSSLRCRLLLVVTVTQFAHFFFNLNATHSVSKFFNQFNDKMTVIADDTVRSTQREYHRVDCQRHAQSCHCAEMVKRGLLTQTRTWSPKQCTLPWAILSAVAQFQRFRKSQQIRVRNGFKRLKLCLNFCVLVRRCENANERGLVRCKNFCSLRR